jgi:hypothetical protein
MTWGGDLVLVVFLAVVAILAIITIDIKRGLDDWFNDDQPPTTTRGFGDAFMLEELK